MGDRTVRCLSIHAGYRCRDSGACCTAGWPIPVETDRLDLLRSALASGRLSLADGRRGLTEAVDEPAGAPSETPGLLKTNAGACVFYRHAGAGRCAIHRALGHDALPLACRQFPRISLIDPRGVSVTLSHYCPTAASMLDADAPVSIVERPPGFPADGEYVGLDLREDLPPSLRPDCLMDWEAWWMLEAEAVSLFARSADPRHALATLGVIVESLRGWRPGEGALTERVRRVVDGAIIDPRGHPRALAHEARLREVLAAIPADLQPEARKLTADVAPPSAVMTGNFLAAHAFANWTAHLGEGLRTWLRSIEAAFALVALGYGVRQADLLLRHLADPHALARGWRAAEQG